MKCTFEIKETLSTFVTVDAESEEDAYRRVKDMYRKEEIVLDSSDYMCTDISLFSRAPHRTGDVLNRRDLDRVI